MTGKWKIFFLTVLATAFLGHFMLVSFYLIKPNLYSNFYVYPFFHQSWNLFVPPPESNYRLYVHDKDQNPKSIEVFGEVLIQHQKNRLKGYEPIVIALANSIHYFEKDAAENKLYEGKIIENENFWIMEKIAKKYLQSERQIDAKNSKIILIVNSVFGGKPRIYFN